MDGTEAREDTDYFDIQMDHFCAVSNLNGTGLIYYLKVLNKEGIKPLIETIGRAAKELVSEIKISVPLLYRAMEATIDHLFEERKLEMFCDLDSLKSAIKGSLSTGLNIRLALDFKRFGRSDWESFVSVSLCPI